MSLALARKEWREHGVILLIVWGLSAAALMGCLLHGDRRGGSFTGLVVFLLAIGTLYVLFLANRLFAREYSGRTQLFLEILPLSRARVFWTKWLMGCVLVQVTVVAAWFATVAWTGREEVVHWHDAWQTLACASLYGLTLWAFAAMAGMLGRYRYIPWAAALIVIFASAEIVGLTVSQLPVLRLLGDDTAMGRPELAPLDVVIPLALTSACIVAGVLLAVCGSGALASALAQRMTARERAFVIVALLAVLTVTATLEPKPIKPDFEIASGERVRGTHASVAVLPTGDLDQAAAHALAATIAADVDALSAALDIEATSVSIMPQQGLDPQVMQRASLSGADGIVVRIAPDAPRESVRAMVLHSLLLDHTHQRAHREDRHMLLDGLSAYWSMREDDATRELWWLRAAAFEGELTTRHLTQWSETLEQLGTCRSQALAFAAVDLVAKQLGEAALLRLMRSLFSEPDDDLRVLFETEPASLLERHGLGWPALTRSLNAALPTARQQHAEKLAHRSAISAEVSVHDSSERGLTVETNVVGATPYRVLYSQLSPWTADVGDLPRLDVRSARGVVPLSLLRGGRVLVAIEADDAILRCPVRLLARRMQLQ